MSLNILFPTTHKAEAFKNIQVNNLTVDGSLTVTNDTNAYLSASYDNDTLVFSNQAIEGSTLNYIDPAAILPLNIAYTNEYINVAHSGRYLFNVQFTLNIQTYTSLTNFHLVIWDDSDSVNVCEQEIQIGSSDFFTLSLNRFVNLVAGKNYAILIKQSVIQSTILTGSISRSFISIVKL